MPSCSGSWFFFCPLLSFVFSSFLRFLLEEVLCETTRFEAWSLVFITFVFFWKALPWENRGCSLVFLCFLVLFFRPFYFPNQGDNFLQLGKWFCALSESRCKDTKSRFVSCAIACDAVRYRNIFLQSLFFVFTEVGTDSFSDVGQLLLMIARIGNKIGLHTAWFLLIEVGMLKNSPIYLHFEYWEEHRK